MKKVLSATENLKDGLIKTTSKYDFFYHHYLKSIDLKIQKDLDLKRTQTSCLQNVNFKLDKRIGRIKGKKLLFGQRMYPNFSCK